MKTLTYDVPKKDGIVLMVLSIALFLLSIAVLYMGLTGSLELAVLGNLTPTFSTIAGVIGILFFSFTSYFWARRLRSPLPAFEITDKGVIDNSTAIASNSMIPFENIEKASVKSFMGNEYISIDVKDEEAVLDSVTPMKRLTMKINKKQFKSSLILINLKGQPKSELENIAYIINDRKS